MTDFFSNPMFQMGLGILGGNYGRNGQAAFANSMSSGLQAAQAAQMMGIRRDAEERQRKAQEYKIQQDQLNRIRAAAQAQSLGMKDPGLFAKPENVYKAYNATKQPANVRSLQYFSSPEGQKVIGQASRQMNMTPAELLQALTGGVTVNTGTSKSPYERFMDQLPDKYVPQADPNAPGGYRAVPIEGIGTAGSNAGWAAMLDSAISAMPRINQTIFKDGNLASGEINRGVLFGKDVSKLPFVPGYLVDKFELTKGGSSLGQRFELGVQAITRIETGAAMPATEVENTRSRFEPKSTDSDGQIRLKMAAYERFLSNANAYLKEGFSSSRSSRDIDFDKLFADAEASLGQLPSEELVPDEEGYYTIDGNRMRFK